MSPSTLRRSQHNAILVLATQTEQAQNGISLAFRARQVGAEDRGDRKSPNERGNVVTLNFASWNQLEGWLRQVDRVRRAA